MDLEDKIEVEEGKEQVDDDADDDDDKKNNSEEEMESEGKGQIGTERERIKTCTTI